MTWNTVNVLGISCTGNTTMKLAWKILNVFAMYQVGFWWVLCPFPCDVFAVYLPGTPPLAPSVYLFLSCPFAPQAIALTCKPTHELEQEQVYLP